MAAAPLVDSYGRVHNNLRISVTDRCNIRCFYCMPETDVHFVDRSEILDFEEIERFVRVAAGLGIRGASRQGRRPGGWQQRSGAKVNHMKGLERGKTGNIVDSRVRTVNG